MKRILRALALAALALGGCAVSAQPQAGFARLLHERLRISPVLKGGFEQTKTLKGFRNPLVSRGEFLVARERGVWWHTRQPFESTLVVTRTRLFTRDAQGQASELVDARDEPGVKQVNELIFSLLAADVDTLAAKFEVVARPVGDAGWTLALTPRDPAIAKFLVRATLAGERDVRTVRIEEARGDTTDIRFTGQAAAQSLAADEADRFR